MASTKASTTTSPKRPADVSVQHLSWLVPARSSNEEASLLLYSIIDKHRAAFTGQSHRNNRVTANLLAGACFALWRAVFLTDNVAKGDAHLEHIESFLGNLIANNTVGYVQDRNDRNFTFLFYMQDAKFRLESIANHKPLAHLVSQDALKSKGAGVKKDWVHLQALVTEAIRQFDVYLSAAKRSSGANEKDGEPDTTPDLPAI